VPVPANLPEPAMIVAISPPAETLDEPTRDMVIALVKQGETVLLCSKHAHLRDNVKRDLALWLSHPQGVA
jgi:hypothetical protein